MPLHPGNILSKHVSDYRLSLPLKFIDIPIYMPGLCFFSRDNCPFYAPIVPDTPCRYCHKDALDHKKYGIYSFFSRKIQKMFFRYKYKCILQNFHEKKKSYYNNEGIFYSIDLLKQYHKHGRKWTINNFRSYIDNNYL
jgi:hypothetical protein